MLGQSAIAVAEMARAESLEFMHVPSVAEMAPGTLEEATVLALFTIGETPWSERDRATIATRLRAGELQLLGLHSASDSCAGWDDFGRLLGARFDGHPWTQRFAIDAVDRDHPSTVAPARRLAVPRRALPVPRAARPTRACCSRRRATTST